MVRIIVGTNDLFTTNPELKKAWDFDKNTISPLEVTAGSHKKAWWICSKGHSWTADIGSRSKGSGCPYCSGRLAVSGVNDLATIYPNISLEWNYPKNRGLNPNTLSAYSNKKVWWKCQKGHEWEASIESRTYKGRNCPYCANQKVLKGFNDLKSLYPKLAAEWNYDRNDGVEPDQIIAYTNKKYWWICEKGHEWAASVNSRVRGNGCRLCSRELVTSFPEQAVYFYLQQVFSDAINGYSDNTITEIDVYIPSVKVGIEYDGQYFHTNLSRERKKNKNVSQKGIRLIRIKEKSALDYGKKTFIEKNSIIYYDPRYKERLNDVIIRLFTILKIKSYPDVNVERDRTIIWSQYIQRRKDNSLQDRFPEIAVEWNYKKNGIITPDKVTCKSGKKVWWICKVCGTEWETTVSHRVGGTGCPNCVPEKISKKNSKIKIGVNDLFSMNPDLVEEWNFDKNQDIDPSHIYYKSSKVVWWRCKYCGYEYQASVVQRTKLKTMCKKCTYAIRRGNLEEQYPDLLKEWDYDKNTELNPKLITPGSGKKAWWKCQICGNVWQSRISHRVNGCRCPKCSLERSTQANIKKVFQYSLDGKLIKQYPSVTIAKKETGITGIYDCCAHRIKTAGGYVWRYERYKKQ